MASGKANLAADKDGDSPRLSLPWQVTSKDLLEPAIAARLDAVPEKAAAVDFLVCEQSAAFVGFSQSTFSALTYLRRTRRASSGPSAFFDRQNPPWQIVLSIDPTEDVFALHRRGSGVRPSCVATEDLEAEHCSMPFLNEGLLRGV